MATVAQSTDIVGVASAAPAVLSVSNVYTRAHKKYGTESYCFTVRSDQRAYTYEFKTRAEADEAREEVAR